MGVQAVVAQGFVDENAIGIQDHSWGGDEIAYMVTQTNRFRAVAAGAPVADMPSAYDGIRWGPDLSIRSGSSRTRRSSRRIGVRGPIMMMHKDADDAVPWYQRIEYYLALRRLRKEAYLFVCNGKPHGLRRRPNQKDCTVRRQQYFDHFQKKGAPKPDCMERGIPYLEGHHGAVGVAVSEEPGSDLR